MLLANFIIVGIVILMLITFSITHGSDDMPHASDLRAIILEGDDLVSFHSRLRVRIRLIHMEIGR